MNLNSNDHFFLKQTEPLKSCLITLRDIILSHDNDIKSEMKYGMPFFCFKGKMVCYLWIHKKYNQPYIGFVEGKLIDHPDLITEKRARMKIMLLDQNKDIPIEKVESILKQVFDLYRNGKIKAGKIK